MFAEALAIQRELGDRRGMSMTNLGNTLLDRGLHDEARTLYLEAHELDEELGDPAGMAHVHNNLGILAGYGQRFDEAHDHYAQALKIRRQLGKRQGVAPMLNCFSDLAELEGQYGRALLLIGATNALIAETEIPLPQHIHSLQ